MSEEERKGETEVEAAYQMLVQAIDDLQMAAEGRHYQKLASLGGEVERWRAVCGQDTWSDVVHGFRRQAANDIDSWLVYVTGAILEGNWSSALATLDGARRELLGYIELLGVEIPPEEEEVPGAPSAVEEPAEERGEEGTPLRVLGLSTRVHNALCLRCPRAEEGRRILFVEDILTILKDQARGEEYLLTEVRLFGPKALEELKIALRAKGFLPAEEEPNTGWEAYDEAVY